MQLLYLYIPHYGILKDVELNFTANHRFKYNKKTRTVEELSEDEMKTTPPLSDDFFSLGSEENVVESISAIVGNNGAGKTSIANLIHDIGKKLPIEHIMIWKIGKELHYSAFIIPTFLSDSEIEEMISFVALSIKKRRGFPQLEKHPELDAEAMKVVKNAYPNKQLISDTQSKEYTDLYIHIGYREMGSNTICSLITPFFKPKLKTQNLYTEELSFNLIYSSNYYTPMHSISTTAQTIDVSTSNYLQTDCNGLTMVLKTEHSTIEHVAGEFIRNIRFITAFHQSSSCEIDFPMPMGCSVSIDDNRESEKFNMIMNIGDKTQFIPNNFRAVLYGIIDRLEKSSLFEHKILSRFIHSAVNAEIYNFGTNKERITGITDRIMELFTISCKIDPREIKTLTPSFTPAENDPIHIYTSFLNDVHSFLTGLSKSDSLFQNQWKEMISFFKFVSSEKITTREKKLYFNLKNPQELDSFSKFMTLYNSTMTKSYYLKTEWDPYISSGEFAQINIFSRLYSQLYGKKQFKHKDVILFMDEIEITIHPDLQRKLVSNLLLFLNHFVSDAKVHIIFATHSPILLSDIPQSNTILLERKNDEVTVKDNAEFPETFGANIHSLYRNSFLLESGTMGSFATGKIKALIKDIEKLTPDISEDKRKHIEDQIAIIGEPYMKRKIEELYESKLTPEKIEDFKEKRIATLEAELKRLKEGESSND